MIIKCKMCGGDLHPEEGNTTYECEFCGTIQTIPTDDGEKKFNLFNRANYLRMNAEFDKAAAVYESIAAEFPTEAEAYWGLCLCAYGIEYVDDPATGEKKPTCHRTLPTSIMEDTNFEQACDYADAIARRIYREEAKAIDRIQKEILSIVSNEAPYDVFICYKETDEDGERTEDSVLAQEIYDELTGKGLKVFFSRITLEDKLGQQYEPYIYAALASAKVMVAVGTRFEYYDAVWVKNEWMRFLSMMRTEKGKTLIPCYKDLDAYDMPKEFKNLQGQDMGKLGWLQDLTRGVMKLCGKVPGSTDANEHNESKQKDRSGETPTVKTYLQRAYLFLEDGKWTDADNYAEKALDLDPQNAEAYLVKLMSEYQIKDKQHICQSKEPLENNENYHKVIRFAESELRERLEKDNYDIKNRVEEEHFSETLNSVMTDLTNARTEEEHNIILNRLETIRDCDETKKLAAEVMNHKKTLEKVREGVKILKEEEAILLRYRKNQFEMNKLSGLFANKHRTELEEKNWIDNQRYDELEKRYSGLTEEPQFDLIRLTVSVLQKRIGCLCYDSGLLPEAAAVFSRLVGYAGVRELISGNEAFSYEMHKAWSNLSDKRGTVLFGWYDQYYGDNMRPTEIEWIVLEYDEENHRALLLSKYGLAACPYNEKKAKVTWADCTLRHWLNNEFLKKAFRPDERSMIMMTDVDNNLSRFNVWNTSGGNNTSDHIFLLSYGEAHHYFNLETSNKYNIKARAALTEFARNDGAMCSDYFKTEDDNSSGIWWLRSPGQSQNWAAYVNVDGTLQSNYVNSIYFSIRPALWINLG